ncbi:fluoride efflux transporter CrcB [Mariniphaga sediminis]|uniref:Fluoride-specific ion channel FluC n=1 Tax=Mariniphaga sediminis TaxID=1628158 RepID=A0A399D028_9BACT|nr:fluoride efflux transporter CrcB [Mariniphaga sediminis]RIH65355.1 fluoride efflux transporter CrcB [Mariniphaga sediminis]
MLRTVMLVGAGGFIGSVMRYLLHYYVEKGLASTFPWGTLIANVVGSFIIGMVFALAEKGNLMNAEWRIFLAVGICGGFTTFSSFAYNNFTMIKEQALGSLLLNVGASLFFGILAVYLGIILIRVIF